MNVFFSKSTKCFEKDSFGHSVSINCSILKDENYCELFLNWYQLVSLTCNSNKKIFGF